jgi:hypothetical protein
MSTDGVETVKALVEGAPELPQAKHNGSTPASPEQLNLDEVKDKHRDLTDEVARLADLKRKVIAGEALDILFEGELHAVAAKYKPRGMTPAKLRAAVEHRLRPPMSPEDAEARLAEKRTQRDEVLQIGLTGELWHDADREAFATIKREGRREIWKVRSRDYRLHMIAEYRRRHGRVPAKQAMG